ncbi:MAG: endonuclease/exonuclease/phosphatase family protein [Bacteroidales bacterium]|nr:endonuclease/exonuclease/phosphatase family protein [Bacteroidales bacterium]
MKHILRKALLSVLAACICSFTLTAKVTLPSVIGDNMVLQQQSEVAIWGWTDSSKKVSVQTSWSKGKQWAEPDSEGKWLLRIKTPAAGGPYEITISDGEKIKLKNIMLGEVWFCSGQSNMEMPMRGFRNQPVEGAGEIIMSAKSSTPIRMITTKHTAAPEPVRDIEGRWAENTPEAVASTSAVAYLFALRLQQKLDVPVGIIVSEWGASTIEAWMDKATLDDKFAGEFDNCFLGESKQPKLKQQVPAALFNGQVCPLVPYTFKGMLWYQGESNQDRPNQYVRLQKEYVAMMRELFRNPEAPFYYVQIAPYNYSNPDGFTYGYFCESQQKSLDVIPHSGMATTIDLGEYGSIHPGKKKEVALRLANLALVNDYGFKGITPTSPAYESAKFENGSATINMKVDGQGLAPWGQNIAGFELAGSDRVFHPATGRIKDNKTLVVTSPEVPEPVAVRYGFRNWKPGNLYNAWNVPAGPFRSDDWDSEGTPAPLRVMSFNIRYSSAKDGENAWDIRKEATPAMIREIKPAVFGLQEAMEDQVQYILEQCPEYKYVGVGRDDGEKKGEQMSVFYDSTRIELLKWGTYWLSETPDVPSYGWDAACRRTATWTLLRHKDSGRQFYFVNTHLDHKGATARKEGLALVYKRIQEMNREGLPMVLTGDFNVFPDDECLSDVSSLMKNARNNAQETDSLGSFSGFGEFTQDRLEMIDYIYYRGFPSCLHFKVVIDSYAGKEFISDHYPIYADLVFPELKI